MLDIKRTELPADSLLARYRKQPGHYTDCFVVAIAKPVHLEPYVAAFYTTWLFRLERLILRVFASLPSRDADAWRLASGEAESFAAWTVEARVGNELLMCDLSGRTRSWFRVEQVDGGSLLLFGSAVVPARSGNGSSAGLGFLFNTLLGFHNLYSRMLLSAAARKLGK